MPKIPRKAIIIVVSALLLILTIAAFVADVASLALAGKL